VEVKVVSTPSLRDVRLGVIGAGVMAEAMITGLLREQVLVPDGVVCADPSAQRLSELAGRYGVRTYEDNAAAIQEVDVILLAVKPQVLGSALQTLRGRLEPQSLLVSIVAGATTTALQAGLQHDRVVRAMPNTPAQVGAGVTVWFATMAVDVLSRERTRTILGALGTEVEVTDERQVSMATAISGSGPAYAFLYFEAMINAAVRLGLQRDLARRLVVETVRGSAEFALQSNRHVAELRDMVTSPGGTSAAALSRLDNGALRGIVDDAVQAAFQRTLELEGGTDHDLGHGPGGGAAAS